MKNAVQQSNEQERKVLISGGGIAGLTLGILLNRNGWDPVIVERDPAFRTSGYMMDFFGTGWDVAERMGVIEEIQRVRYPFEYREYVDQQGRPRFPRIPLEQISQAFYGKSVSIRRPDLARILYNRATSEGVSVRFGTTIEKVRETDMEVEAQFNNGDTDSFRLLFGADGVHSRVREMVFGPVSVRERFLGYYVAGCDLESSGYDLGDSVKVYEEPGRAAWFYPLKDRMEALYFFSFGHVGHLPHEKRLPFVRERYKGAGWIAEKVLQKLPESEPTYFDSMTQKRLPSWQKGRVALLGDACGCLTPLASQGSHMAMAAAFILAQELQRHSGDHRRAFLAYEDFLKPIVSRKQDLASHLAHRFIPRMHTPLFLRYLAFRLAFSPLFIRHFLASFGGKSILDRYPALRS
ncbi:MAG: FAD-dependent monooxygenase [Methanomicrobiales archaeon]|nr:FAD-dependent monooxygenase [Methanomicrobiales archaeon]